MLPAPALHTFYPCHKQKKKIITIKARRNLVAAGPE